MVVPSIGPFRRSCPQSHPLGEVVSTGLPVTISTIYDSSFDEEKDREIANAGLASTKVREIANAGLAVFNDAITREATMWNVRIMDLRVLFNSPDDYANAIEPSTKGGEKIARHIRHLVCGA